MDLKPKRGRASPVPTASGVHRHISGVHEQAHPSEEVIVPFPGPRASIPPATAYRSTWVVSSLDSLRYHGHFERYLEALREHREEILSCIAGTWLPMRVVSAHYRACDALTLSEAQVIEMGQGPGVRVRRAWYARFIAAAEGAKEDPWTILSQLGRTWLRGANGGAAGVFRIGPKEARVEYVGCELFRIPYYCQAVRVVLFGLVERFGVDASVRMLRDHGADDGVYVLQWG
jgi:hypothetical protein